MSGAHDDESHEMSLDDALSAALRYVDEMVAKQPELQVFAAEAKRGLIEAAALARNSAADDVE